VYLFVNLFWKQLLWLMDPSKQWHYMLQLSRHTVVCCAAQKAGASHLWGQLHHLTFQFSTKSCQAFARYEPSKIGWVSLFFFSSFHQGGKAAIKHKSIIRLPWNLVQDKGISWYQICLQYHKWSQRYKQLWPDFGKTFQIAHHAKSN